MVIWEEVGWVCILAYAHKSDPSMQCNRCVKPRNSSSMGMHKPRYESKLTHLQLPHGDLPSAATRACSPTEPSSPAHAQTCTRHTDSNEANPPAGPSW